jgi:putative tryptophan/tyrosine transport system substrate-binding protein
MKKIIYISICLIIFFNAGSIFAGEKKYKILSIQHQNFNPYIRSLKGFKNGIIESGYKDKIDIIEYNAKGDLKALDMYIEKLKTNNDIDLIFSLGTQATKRVIKNIKNIPIVFTDLGTPEFSGIVTDWKTSNANYTGVETRNYVTIGINLLHELIKFETIGMIYLEGSPSHDGAIKQVTQTAKTSGFDFIYKGFSLRDNQGKKYPKEVIRKNIKEALDYVVPKVDVFYVQVSKTFNINFDLFFENFKTNSIPSAGDPVYIKKGLVMGIGRNKEQFGKQCAEYVVKILNGTDPASLPMDVGQSFSISLNTEAATIVGYNPSIDILSAADDIYKEMDVKK